MPINTHAFASEEVMAYLDGELSPETAAEMTAHLAHCRTCQEIAADLQGVSRQLSGWMVQASGCRRHSRADPSGDPSARG